LVKAAAAIRAYPTGCTDFRGENAANPFAHDLTIINEITVQ
jgi:hypothetical protein